MLRIILKSQQHLLDEAAKFDLPDAHLVLLKEPHGNYAFDLYIRHKDLSQPKYSGGILFGPNLNFRNVWMVKNVEADVDGFGPALYEAAMELAQRFGADGLAPDNASVSQEAEEVWLKYFRRSDIAKTPLPEGYRQMRRPEFLKNVFSKSNPHYLNELIRSGKLVDKTGVLVS